MPKKTSFEIIKLIRELLGKESNLSVRQIAKEIKSEWSTVNYNLEFMKSNGMVKEISTENVKRDGRRFQLV